jgi:SAM-dependent methyltransferase
LEILFPLAPAAVPGGDVLEVGAGIGGSTALLYDGSQRHWVCLEPDPRLAGQISRQASPQLSRCEIVVGTIHSLAGRTFDAIAYIDVLEHIEDDRSELAAAAEKLKPGGHIIVLAPAHQWLFTPFDKAIGHYRRYTKKMLLAITPGGTVMEKFLYLDSVGLLASLANRLLLRSAHPNLGQIRFWDRALVPLSRGLDPLLGYKAGKSVLAVWRKVEPGS